MSRHTVQISSWARHAANRTSPIEDCGDRNVKRGAEISDGELIAAYLAGDERAWETLIRRFQGLIYSVALRSGLSEADAQDIFQEVCLKLYHNLTSLRNTERVAAWLASTTRREAWRLLRRRQHSSLDAIDPSVLEHEIVRSDDSLSTDLAGYLIAHERVAQVRSCFRKLPGDCQTLLGALYGPEQVKHVEVAARMSLALGTIGPKRARCLQRLQKLLDESGSR